MELHPACEDIAFLIGTWTGSGSGHYPTIEPFEYLEEVVFGHVGKPFLSYTQKTRHRDTGEPLHAETGYLRAVANGQVELVLAQPSGIVEMHGGIVVDKTVTFTLESVHVTPTAKQVSDVQREFRVTVDERGGATLDYDLFMAAVGEPLTHHLQASLTRQSVE